MKIIRKIILITNIIYLKALIASLRFISISIEKELENINTKSGRINLISLHHCNNFIAKHWLFDVSFSSISWKLSCFCQQFKPWRFLKLFFAFNWKQSIQNILISFVFIKRLYVDISKVVIIVRVLYSTSILFHF